MPVARPPAAAPKVSPIAALEEKVGPLDQAFLRSAATIDADRLSAYGTAAKYYDGDTQSKLTDRAKEYLELSGLPYNENFCETVVDALADRLRISGITSDDEDFASFVWDVLWDRNRLDAHQGVITTEVLKKGDAYLIVDWDAKGGYPCVKLNAPEHCQVHYEDGEKVWASKWWTTAAKGPLNENGAALVRMNVYWPDRIEKYFRLSSDANGAWSIWVDADDLSWPVAWITPDKAPLGIPVFHLANKAGTKKFGRAEHRGTIPQQDRLNKDLIDLSLILDTQGWAQRFIAGDDATIQVESAPGRWFRSPRADTVFGQFDAADPAGALAAVEADLHRIASRSKTPSHLIVASGGAPSGESLKTAEAGLVAKAKDRSLPLGEEWIGVVRMMATLAAIFGNGVYKPALDVAAIADVTLNVQWADFETRNEKEHLDSLIAMDALGVSKRTLLSMIPGINAEDELEQAEKEAAAAGAQMAAFVSGGGVPQAPGAPGGTQPAPGAPPIDTRPAIPPASIVRPRG